MGRGINKSSFEHWPIFAFLSLIFLTNYSLQSIGFSSAFTRNYLDDLLAMPVILWLCRTSLRLIYGQQKLELDFVMIVLSFLLVSLLFEIILPHFFMHLTSDFLDVVCYGLGVIFYQLVLSS